MTLNDHEVRGIINALLDREGIGSHERVQRLRNHRAGAASLAALEPIVARYLAIMDHPQTCQVEHDHWEGRMICGNPMPCPTHGGR